jgi:CheY-like chemotaxis protein
VEDSGIGIPEDKISNIFEKFSQAEVSTTRKFGGTGLGLAISGRLVGMMGGKINVKSELGKGSTFGFDITLAVSKTNVKAHHDIPDCDLSGLRVLVVDDSKISREILLRWLNVWHLLPDPCVSAEEAIEKIQQAADSAAPYQFVIADYRLKGAKSGKDLAIEAKANPAHKDIIFFMITSLTQIINSGSLKASGFSGFLTKPFYPDQLKSALQILWDATINGKDVPLMTHAKITSMLKAEEKQDKISKNMFSDTQVLVVEDVKVNLMLITRILENHGCTVFSATNGTEALTMAHSSRYDIIFMDCQMPEMDGFEATAKIRKQESSHTVIVALTADAMSGDREKCLAAGMDDYLNKPIKPKDITDMLKKWIQR